VFGLFKKKKLDLSNYKEDAFLEMQWIEHFFVVSFQKPKDKARAEFLNYLYTEVHQELLSFLGVYTPRTREVGKSVSVKSYFGKDLPLEYKRVLQINSDENSYFTLIRFPNARKEDLEKGTLFSFIDSSEKRSYKFSPLQSINVQEIYKSVEYTLHVLTKIKPQQVMTLITGVDDEVVVYEFDGLQYFSYPLSKRAELYSKYPELHAEIFPMDFKKFADWIIGKENDDETMKHNADLTRKILRKFDF
jgi:hypothetical protein